ncbi:four-carbon acid sugar kinase family protein [Primorskyibacter marinus]|uniref:four-carbon acid sugar kinase family protein n=1 Tax=Primorskyibacter marinus TaxID=1977320 RepID=UPI001E375638|nr:four-carbon acid sugar kinase family protein [Primorskyibacter marinus]
MSEQIEQLVIVADDLTGALDMAAPFCAPGSSVLVATLADALARNADVTAVSTRTRDVDPDAASRCVAPTLKDLTRDVE